MSGVLSLFLDIGALGVAGSDPDLSTICLLWKERGKKVAPSSEITFQLAEPISQMFSLSCFLFLHSGLIWPR